jgi:hypothetical protein
MVLQAAGRTPFAPRRRATRSVAAPVEIHHPLIHMTQPVASLEQFAERAAPRKGCTPISSIISRLEARYA